MHLTPNLDQHYREHQRIRSQSKSWYLWDLKSLTCPKAFKKYWYYKCWCLNFSNRKNINNDLLRKHCHWFFQLVGIVCREKGNCKVQIISELPLYLVHFILIKMERLTCFRPQFNLPLDILRNHPALWK